MKHPGEKHDGLATCLDSWRRRGTAQPESLSATARANVLRAARVARADAPAEGTWSVPRWVFAAAAPTLTVAALAGLWTLSLPEGEVAGDPGASHVVEISHKISVSKVGDEIVFDIANGTQVHEILKSTTPRHFDERTRTETGDGSYKDALNNGVTLTFYKID